MHFHQQKSRLTKFGKRFWKVLVLLTIFAICLAGSWFILKAVLSTDYPLVPVYSDNMCIIQPHCDGFTHPFERTLHKGDVIVIQGINAKSVEAEYPNSDVVVFHTPKQDPSQEDRLIITRVITKEEKDDIVYFRTKSDGEGTHKWPEMPDIKECERWSDYRENYTWNGMISEKLLVGKVVLRIPWVGHIVSFITSYSGILIVAVLIIIFIIAKFIVPKYKDSKAKTKHENDLEKVSET